MATEAEINKLIASYKILIEMRDTQLANLKRHANKYSEGVYYEKPTRYQSQRDAFRVFIKDLESLS